MKLISFTAYNEKIDNAMALGMTEETAEAHVAKSYQVDWSL